MLQVALVRSSVLALIARNRFTNLRYIVYAYPIHVEKILKHFAKENFWSLSIRYEIMSDSCVFTIPFHSVSYSCL